MCKCTFVPVAHVVRERLLDGGDSLGVTVVPWVGERFWPRRRDRRGV